MTSPNLPGVNPTNSAAWTPPEQFTYDHVPLLRELLPQLRGVPGFYYLQCSVLNKRRAEAEGWQEVANTVTYSIAGPNGQIDATLYCFGERISGSDYSSGKRDCLVDLDIFEATGHTNKETAEANAETVKVMEFESEDEPTAEDSAAPERVTLETLERDNAAESK